MDDWLLRPPTPPQPPMPTDSGEQARVQHTRLRRRMLEGIWADDLRQRLQRHLGSLRKRAVGPEDLSGQIFGVLCRELATLHLQAPAVRHNSTDDLSDLTNAFEESGLWSMMTRYQSMVIGCREYLVRIHASESGLVYRPVAPDMVVARATMDRPDRPVAIGELRLRDDPKKPGAVFWAWDRIEAEPGKEPVYQIIKQATQEDVSAAFDVTGWPDVWRRADGTPELPYVLHHASRMPDRLFDPWLQSELVEGSLNHAVLLSLWMHLVRDASWPQRWSRDCHVVGLLAADDEGGGVQEVVTDPASLVQFKTDENAISPDIGQFDPGGDPQSMLASIEAYAARLAQDAGVAASDLHRMSGDPRSGYAISLTNDGKRASQRRFAAPMRHGDQELVAKSAIMLNRARGLKLPESSYSVAYHAIPLSPEELKARREHVLEMLDRGLMSRVEAYMELHPGVTPEQARRELAAIDSDRALRAAPML